MPNDAVRNLQIIITADAAQASAAMKGVAGETAATGTSLKQLGSDLTSVGKSLTTYVTLPIVAAGAASVDMTMKFQQNMELIKTQAGATQDEVDSMSKSVLQLAQSSEFGPNELAQGLYHVESEGYRGAQAMDILKAASEGAAVGQANMEDTTNALTAAMKTGIKGATDATTTMATLNAVVGQGNMHLADLTAAMSTGILASAQNFGLSLQDVGAALDVMTQKGVPAQAAATRLRMNFSQLATPTAAAQKALESIGLSQFDLATKMRTEGLIPALEELKAHLSSTFGDTTQGLNQQSDAITKIFGGGRSSSGILTLMNNLNDLKTTYDAVGGSINNFSSDVAAQQDTASGRMHAAWAKIQADAIILGQELLPPLSKAFDTVATDVTKVVNWYDQLSPSSKKVIDTTLGIAAVIGPTTFILGSFATKVSGIIKLFKDLAGLRIVGGLAGMLGLGGGEAAAGAAGIEGTTAAIAGGGGLLAALGPLALGIAAVGLAGLGTYEVIKHLKTSTEEYGAATTGTIGSETLLALAHEDVAAKTQAVTNATNSLNTARATLKNDAEPVKQAEQDVASAQAAVKDAYDKFGASSPQYAAAEQVLADKTDALNGKLLAQWGHTVDLKTAEDNLATAHSNLASSTADLNRLQDILNKGLDSGVSIVAKFGPTSLNQVAGVDTLQNHLSIVVQTFNGFAGNLQAQMPNMTGQLQGLGSTINRLQGQSNTLNVSLQNAGANIQGGNVKLQAHASGTDYAPGGWSLVGEEGPELVNMPRGASVLPADQTSHVLSGLGGGAGGVNITIQAGTVVGANGAQDLAAMVYRELQRLAKANGFNGALPNIGVMPTG